MQPAYLVASPEAADAAADAAAVQQCSEADQQHQ
jgi:hypothetical protein